MQLLRTSEEGTNYTGAEFWYTAQTRPVLIQTIQLHIQVINCKTQESC